MGFHHAPMRENPKAAGAGRVLLPMCARCLEPILELEDSLDPQANSYDQEIVVNLRTAVIAAVASGLLAIPTTATASPLPDPPSRSASDMVQLAIDQLIEAYADASVWDKRSIHNEIVLLINVGHAAL